MPTLALLADIHGNLAALEAVLAAVDALAPDAVACLGDTLDYGPYPAECLALLRSRQIDCVLGNHDLAVVDAAFRQGFLRDCERTLPWTAQQLDAESRDYVRSLPQTLALPWGQLVHGSPYDPLWHYVVDGTQALVALRRSQGHVAVGHTHHAGAFVLKGPGPVRMVPARMQERNLAVRASKILEIPAGSRCIVNPGSVGQPRDLDPRASFCIIEGNGPAWQRVQWYRVPYPVAETAAAVVKRGLPAHFGERLYLGR